MDYYEKSYKGSVLYISGPRTLTAAANYPAVMHIPEGSNIRYIGSKNNETIFIINDRTSGTLEGGVGKENTVVMNVKANNIVANLHSGTIRYGNSSNIRLFNTYDYVSNSDNKQNTTTHCKTRFINVKNAEIWQNSFNCTNKDYEVRVVNKENVHHRGLKQTTFVVNEDSDNARIVSDLGSTRKIKGNIDVIRVQVNNITQWGISEDIEKGVYSLDLLANNRQNIVSSTKINDFKNLVIQVNCCGITESVVIQDKSLSNTIEDIRYQKLRNSGNDISGEVIQNSEKKLKAFIQASILDQELADTYQVAKDIANNNNLDMPVSQIEVTKNHMGILSEKVTIAGMYSGQVIVDFSYNNSDVTSSYQKYRNNGGSYSYDDYMMLCNYYQDITLEGEKTHHRYVIKLPDTLNSEISSSPIRLNLKIKNKVAPYQSIPYDIIDFAGLNIADINSIGIEEGKRSYINGCYNESISDLTEDSLEIKDITVLDSKGNKWSLSIGLVDYFQSPEHQQIVLRMNNELYKIDSTNLRLERIKMNPNSFRHYQPDEQGLQVYHNQPINNHDIGLVDFRDKSILDFDMEIADDSLVLLHKNNTLTKVENWETYQPAREMMFAFNDTMVSNAECIFSACNSEDIIEDFNKEKVTLLEEQVFTNIVQKNMTEAEDLMKKITSLNTDGKHELKLLHLAIKKHRLDIIRILYNQRNFLLESIDINGCAPLSLAAQKGSVSIAKFLLSKGGYIFGGKDPCGTPIRIAAHNGDIQMLELLFNEDVNIQHSFSTLSGIVSLIQNIEKEFSNQTDIPSNAKMWKESFIKEKLEDLIKRLVKEPEQYMLDSCNDLFSSGINNYDKKLFNEAIIHVIESMYGRVDMKRVLNCIYSYNNPDYSILGVMAVFDTMKRRGDLKNAVFELAHWIKEKMDIYKNPSVITKEGPDFEMLKNQLPGSVRNAVFASSVCIRNVKDARYLYSPINSYKYDDYRGYVFTWPSKVENDPQLQWQLEFSDNDIVYLRNVKDARYLYSPANSYKYDDYRGYVFTWPSKVENDPQLQWRVEDCGSDKRIFLGDEIDKINSADSFRDKLVSAGNSSILDRDTDIRAKLNLDNELLIAAKDCKLNEIGKLIRLGANVNTKNKKNEWTSLHWAAYRGCLGAINLLIDAGAEIDVENDIKRTPLHLAARNCHSGIVQVFTEKGANIYAIDKDGKTPFNLASWQKELDITSGQECDRTIEHLIESKEVRLIQRKRRDLHGDHDRYHGCLSCKPLAIDPSNQPEVEASSSTRPSSWINNCISWVKKLAVSTFSIIPGLPAQYNIGSIPDKNDDINVKSDNNNIPQSISAVGWNNFLNSENVALVSCVADALDDTLSRRYQGLISKGVEVIPSRKVAVEFALRKFDSFVEGKIRNLGSKEQARIRVEIKDAYPEITASLERGVEFSGNVGLDNVLEKCKKCFCTNVLPKDKVSTCLSDVGVTKLGNNLNR